MSVYTRHITHTAGDTQISAMAGDELLAIFISRYVLFCIFQNKHLFSACRGGKRGSGEMKKQATLPEEPSSSPSTHVMTHDCLKIQS